MIVIVILVEGRRDSGILIDVVVTEGAIVLELLVRKNQTNAVGRQEFLHHDLNVSNREPILNRKAKHLAVVAHKDYEFVGCLQS